MSRESCDASESTVVCVCVRVRRLLLPLGPALLVPTTGTLIIYLYRATILSLAIRNTLLTLSFSIVVVGENLQSWYLVQRFPDKKC